MTWIYLSHVLAETTPLYGKNGEVRIRRSRSMSRGDSSNNSELIMPSHVGTHVDAPNHFDAQGLTLDRYPADHWRCLRPALLHLPSEPGELLGMERMASLLEQVPGDCDILLLRTGAQAWRTDAPDTYACRGPGVAAGVAHWLRSHRHLKFLGMDFVSISSHAHRDAGREAHRAFLGPQESGSAPILLIEDMALAELSAVPKEVWVVPILFSGADGAPATVFARV